MLKIAVFSLTLLGALCESPRARADETAPAAAAPEGLSQWDAPGNTDDAAVWSLFKKAFAAALNGRPGEARAALSQIETAHPQHRLAAQAHEIISALDRRESPAPQTASFTDPETPTGGARASLVIFQTLHGIALGGEISSWANFNDARPIVASLMAGGGVGLALSLSLAHEIRPGQAAAYNAGTTLGFFNGLSIAQIAGLDSDTSVPPVLIASQLAGLGGGILADHLWRPRDGDVSLMDSGALWAGALMLFANGMNDFNASERTTWTTLLVAVDAGALAGALLTAKFPMSRGRALIIDAGGIMGMLTGMGVAVLASQNNNNAAGFWTAAMAGTVLGLGTGTYFSRHWDAPELPAHVSLLPTPGGAQLLVALKF